jgi:hypothetical protein
MGTLVTVRDDVLWTPWVADLVERVDQDVLVVRLECNVEVGGASGSASELGGKMCLTSMSFGARGFARLWKGAAARTERKESWQ